MRCPKCKKDINIGKQVREADKEFYRGVEPPIMLTIFCENCEEPVAMISIDTTTGEDIIDSVVGPVHIPKI